MRIALGLKAHSGWAVLVAVGVDGRDPGRIVDRRRLELIEADQPWAKQPYHAAEGRPAPEARRIVATGIDSARRLAVRELRAAIRHAVSFGTVTACAVLGGEPMPDWTVDEILAVHFRMHKAEGVLFRDALGRAVRRCGVPLVTIPEKQLGEQARRVLKAPPGGLAAQLASLGNTVGAPWGRDQKEASLAALIALSASKSAR
jgi:hypothetical protein